MKFCWFYQKAIRWVGDHPDPMPSWLQAHARTCSACRSLRQADRQLVEALRAQAHAQVQRPAPSHFMHARIIARLEGSSPAAVVPWVSWVRAALVPALGVGLLGAYLAWYSDSRVVTESSSVDLTADTEAPSFQPDPVQLLTWTEKLHDPLESELHLVLADARTAVRSIGETFLPSEFLARREP